MSDIVERLRLDAEPTESDMEEAAGEIERLRARVEVLERVRRTALSYLFDPSMENGTRLLTALQETRP